MKKSTPLYTKASLLVLMAAYDGAIGTPLGSQISASLAEAERAAPQAYREAKAEFAAQRGGSSTIPSSSRCIGANKERGAYVKAEGELCDDDITYSPCSSPAGPLVWLVGQGQVSVDTGGRRTFSDQRRIVRDICDTDDQRFFLKRAFNVANNEGIPSKVIACQGFGFMAATPNENLEDNTSANLDTLGRQHLEGIFILINNTDDEESLRMSFVVRTRYAKVSLKHNSVLDTNNTTVLAPGSPDPIPVEVLSSALAYGAEQRDGGSDASTRNFEDGSYTVTVTVPRSSMALLFCAAARETAEGLEAMRVDITPPDSRITGQQWDVESTYPKFSGYVAPLGAGLITDTTVQAENLLPLLNGIELASGQEALPAGPISRSYDAVLSHQEGVSMASDYPGVELDNIQVKGSANVTVAAANSATASYVRQFMDDGASCGC